jgi:hypothetical protein
MSKESALAQFLGVDIDDVVERHNNNFEVNPRTKLVGTSPDEAKRLVEQLFKALDLVPRNIPENGDWMVIRDGEPWTYPIIRLFGYRPLERALRRVPEAAEMLEVGIHEVLNTLYFLRPETDDEKHAVDHRDTLREAAQGLPIQDRRTSVPTDDGEYLVLTDDEADEMWDEQLDNYIDECILAELPKGVARNYFDRAAWKRDARHDGRGHSLSSYDGNEDKIYDEEDEETYYIYRTN